MLSGGEKVRLAFARLLIKPPHFLLLDEPTTHLDIAAREALEQALVAFTGTLCIVSHDIEFVKNVAAVIVAMTPPGITRYSGDYDYYLAKTAAVAAPIKEPKGPSGRRAGRQASAVVVQKYSKVRRELQKEIEKLEKKIGACESEQSELLEQMKGTGVDYAAINRELSVLQQKVTGYQSRWEAFAIELDSLEREYKAARRVVS